MIKITLILLIMALFGANYTLILEDFISDMKENLFVYLKTLIVSLGFYINAPSSKLNVFLATTKLSLYEIELATKIVDGFIGLFFSSFGAVLTLYLTYRFDKWKKKRK